MASSGQTQKDSGEKSEPSIVPVVVVGGIGVLALANFALFGLMGKSDVDKLQNCKPNCAESDVDSARTKLIIADISLGVGVIGVGVAAFLYFTRPKIETKVQTGTSSLRLTGGPVPGGATAGIGGSF